MHAQNNYKYRDKLILKNGNKIIGQLIDYKYGDKITIQLISGSTLIFPDSIIEKLETFSSKPEKNYNFKPKGIYYYFGFNFIPNGGSEFSIPSSGLGVEFATGYRFNQYFSTGLGFGVETFNEGFGEFFFPVYIDFISFLKKSYVSPFIRLQAGYSFIKTTNEYISESNGGVLLNPAFGIRFSAKKSVDYTLDVNFKYQKANFVYHQTNRWNPITSYRDVIFRRFSLRFGILF